MQAIFYWLEDYLEARAGTSSSTAGRAIYRHLTDISAAVGDAFSLVDMSRASPGNEPRAR